MILPCYSGNLGGNGYKYSTLINTMYLSRFFYTLQKNNTMFI